LTRGGESEQDGADRRCDSVIVAMFIATWVIALLVWRLGRIEERWMAHLRDSGAVD
jgi:hypothetical protein